VVRIKARHFTQGLGQKQQIVAILIIFIKNARGEAICICNKQLFMPRAYSHTFGGQWPLKPIYIYTVHQFRPVCCLFSNMCKKPLHYRLTSLISYKIYSLLLSYSNYLSMDYILYISYSCQTIQRSV
jgi:hypothetical protein